MNVNCVRFRDPSTSVLKKATAQRIKNPENCVFRYFKGVLLVLDKDLSENESITRVIGGSLRASGDEGGLMVF